MGDADKNASDNDIGQWKFFRASRYIKNIGDITNSYNILLAIVALLGFPTLTFGAYVFFSGVPLIFLAPSDLVVFTLSLYMSLIFAVVISRCLIFALTLVVSFAAVGLKYKKFSVGGIGTRMLRSRMAELEKKIERFGANKEDVQEIAQAYLRHSKWFLVKKMRISRDAEQRFNSTAFVLLTALLAVILFAYLFCGYHIFIWGFYLYFFLGLAVNIYGGPYSGLAPFVEQYVYASIVDNLPDDYHSRDQVQISSRRKVLKSQISDYKNTIYKITDKMRYFIEARIADFSHVLKERRAFGLLISVVAIIVGYSKSHYDQSRFYTFQSNTGSECVAPLFIRDGTSVVVEATEQSVKVISTEGAEIVQEDCSDG